VDEERQNWGMLEDTWRTLILKTPTYGYTKYQQGETTHEDGLPPKGEEKKKEKKRFFSFFLLSLLRILYHSGPVTLI
jgi:hypothetical protein